MTNSHKMKTMTFGHFAEPKDSSCNRRRAGGILKAGKNGENAAPRRKGENAYARTDGIPQGTKASEPAGRRLRVVHGKGVAKTSVDEIVRGANVAKGTFYLYFHDKDQLLGQLVYNISAQVLEEAYEWLDERRTPDFVENVLLLLDYVVEYFKRNKLVLRLVERNFSWPMVAKQMSERRGPLWARLMRDLEASPLAARYTEDELFKMIFVIIEMLGSVCYSSIIEGKPDTVDNMKPVLYGIVRKILS